MTSTSETHNVLKTDTRGRVRVPAERREALLDEFDRSGLSGVKFAELAGVKYPTFALWAQKRRKARQSQTGGTSAPETSAPAPVAAPAAIRLFEVFNEAADSGGSSSGLTIDLPGGAKVRLDSPRQLRLTAELLQLLGAKGGRAC